MHREPTTFSAESYFETQSAPATLQHDVEKVREFVERQQKEGRNVVLVTVSIFSYLYPFHEYAAAPPSPFLFFDSIVKSGGTTVPLELNV